MRHTALYAHRDNNNAVDDKVGRVALSTVLAIYEKVKTRRLESSLSSERESARYIYMYSSLWRVLFFLLWTLSRLLARTALSRNRYSRMCTRASPLLKSLGGGLRASFSVIRVREVAARSSSSSPKSIWTGPRARARALLNVDFDLATTTTTTTTQSSSSSTHIEREYNKGERERERSLS